MLKSIWSKMTLAVIAMLVGIALYTVRLLAAPEYAFQFESSSSYLQTDAKARMMQKPVLALSVVDYSVTPSETLKKGGLERLAARWGV
jgi:hypothetical protein